MAHAKPRRREDEPGRSHPACLRGFAASREDLSWLGGLSSEIFLPLMFLPNCLGWGRAPSSIQPTNPLGSERAAAYSRRRAPRWRPSCRAAEARGRRTGAYGAMHRPLIRRPCSEVREGMQASERVVGESSGVARTSAPLQSEIGLRAPAGRRGSNPGQSLAGSPHELKATAKTPTRRASGRREDQSECEKWAELPNSL